jgi:hypothetical protein
MTLKNKLILVLLSYCLTILSACGVYSFTGAAIQGKTINVHFIDNNARTIVPSLSQIFTERLRQRIISQSSLSQSNSEKTDYDISGAITSYDVTVAAISGAEISSKNRLTIVVTIDFQNRLNEKANFVSTFTRFADFSSDQNIQNIETKLITQISNELADDIFNKAFVNW